MATTASISNKQNIEVEVSGPDDINRMYICTGKMNVFLQASNQNSQRNTFVALLDPQFESGQFRRAVATAGFAHIQHRDHDPAATDNILWEIEEAEADFDDESGQVELRVSLLVSANGAQNVAVISGVSFQVTILAAISG